MKGVDEVLGAAKDNNVAELQRLLDAGASPDTANVIDQSALHIASLWGSLDAIRLLLSAGAQVNSTNRFGATPLHCAAQRKQASAGRLLLEHRADPAIVAGNSLRAYEMCPDVDLRALFGMPRTELHSAAAAEEPVPALEAVLRESASVDLNAQDERGDTALSIVARRAHASACSLLIERGADCNSPNRSGKTALHEAVSLALVPEGPASGTAPPRLSVLATVRALLALRAEPNLLTVARSEFTDGSWDRRHADGSTSKVTDDGTSCLHLAVQASGDRPEVVELLLDAGAALDPRSGETLGTPLHSALELRFLAVAALLLRRGADLHLGNKDGGLESTPLHYAAQACDLDSLALLIKARADVDRAGRAGMRALHLVARTGTVQMAELLLGAGAHADVVDARGKTPADYARVNPRQAAVLGLLTAATSAAN